MSSLSQELECLQDHLEELIPECREIVGNLTELESEVGVVTNADLHSSRAADVLESVS